VSLGHISVADVGGGEDVQSLIAARLRCRKALREEDSLVVEEVRR